MINKKILNCDIGERGADHSIDDELMSYIDMANIATGGHAGDLISMHHYIDMAIKHDVTICAHIGYPDVPNFGRVSMDISIDTLKESIKEQIETFTEVISFFNIDFKYIKFHGALYNDMWHNKALVEEIMPLVDNYIIVAPFDSEMALYERSEPILNECYVERGYNYDGKFSLMSRDTPGSVIDCELSVITNYNNLSNDTIIIDSKKHNIKCDTICIHSDNKNVINIVKRLRGLDE